jgi:hypothetical protein
MQHQVQLRFPGLQRSGVTACEGSGCLRGEKDRQTGQNRKALEELADFRDAQRKLPLRPEVVSSMDSAGMEEFPQGLKPVL